MHSFSIIKIKLCILSTFLYNSYILSEVLLVVNIIGLYSGFAWLASGRILGLGARFGIYEILTAFYKGTT